MTALSVGFLPSDYLDSYDEAIDSGWEDAINETLKTFKVNTWDLVPKPENINVIDFKWIFCKKNVHRTEIKKAPLVA